MQRNDSTGQVKIEVLYLKSRKGLHTSRVAHQTGTYPGFTSMKRPGEFLLLPG